MPQRLRAVVLEGERRQGRLLAKGPAAAGSEGSAAAGPEGPAAEAAGPTGCSHGGGVRRALEPRGPRDERGEHQQVHDPQQRPDEVRLVVHHAHRWHLLALPLQSRWQARRPNVGRRSSGPVLERPTVLLELGEAHVPGPEAAEPSRCGKACPGGDTARRAPCGRRPAPSDEGVAAAAALDQVAKAAPAAAAAAGVAVPPPPPPKPPKPSPPPPPMPCDWTIGRERLCAKEWDRPECADGVPVWCGKYNADEAACNNAYAKRITGKYGWCFYESGACKLVGDFDCPNLDLDATTTAPVPITTIAPATTTKFEIYQSPPPPPPPPWTKWPSRPRPPMPTPTPWWQIPTPPSPPPPPWYTTTAPPVTAPTRPRRRPRRRRRP